MLTCKDAHKLVVRSQDKPLPWRERLGLRLHIMICAACANFERQMGFLREACRRFPWND